MAIETGVGLAHNYHNLAVAYHQINQTDVAIKCFEKVVELEPHNAPAYNNLGVLYFLKGAHKKRADVFLIRRLTWMPVTKKPYKISRNCI